MDYNVDYSTSQLEHLSYRYLQQLAKSMKLPSNVKKVYLVEMINAKKCSPESEVQKIVQRVKTERKTLTKAKKRSRKTEIPVDTSSNESFSPPIGRTPKRQPFMLRCSELRHQMMRSQPSLIGTSNPGASDRVLRSCNVRVKGPFTNKLAAVNQRHAAMVEQGPQHPVRAVHKFKPNILQDRQKQLVPATQIGSTQLLLKRQRLLSGIYPIRELVPVGGVGVRNREGKMAAIAAFIHKPADQGTSSIRELVPVAEVGVRKREGKMAATAAFIHKPADQDSSFTRELVPVGEVGVRKRESKMAATAAFIHKPADQDTSFTRELVPVGEVGVRKRESKMAATAATAAFIHKPADQYTLFTRELVPVAEVGFRKRESKMAATAAFIHKPADQYTSCTRELVPVGEVGVRKRESKMAATAATAAFIHKPADQYTSFTRELVPVAEVGVCKRESKMAATAAFIHKPANREMSFTSPRGSAALKRNIELTLQDIINGKVENSHSLQYPNTSGVYEDASDYMEVTPETTNSVYYHKKIRAEQVREHRMSYLNTRCALPCISEAFDQFRGQRAPPPPPPPPPPRDVTRPLHVHVGEEAERLLNYPVINARNTNLLETVYNFKNQFMTHQPLLQLATTTNTRCVYSTPTVATPVPHTATTVTYTEPYMASYEPVSQYYGSMDNSRQTDCERFVDQGYDFQCYEEQNRSSSSVGTMTSQDLGANVTISDMVEDALELISQDGDYMERMGMDVRMQCVLCDWAGPRIILECHIRKEHSNDIDKQEKRDWNITYTLGSVQQQLWVSRVMEHDNVLYVLSVKLQPPGQFMATLSSLTANPELTTGSITVFNRVTGEPHIWSGEIQELPPSLPYDSQPGLQLDLAELDLLPNSANLKLQNGELVLQSPTKVVFGPIELNDIHIILFVKVSKLGEFCY